MMRPALFPFLLLMMTSAAGAQTPNGRSLAECYQAAIQRSESLSEQDLAIETAREHEVEARGAMLPNLSGSASYLRQEKAPSSDYEAASRDQPTVKLTLSQPLFRGLRDIATLNEMKHLTESQELSKTQALDQLYADVAQSFFGILELEAELRNLATELTHYKQRIGDLQTRARTGESSATDALVAEASRSQVDATRIQGEGQLRSARESFAFLTGLDRDTPLNDGGQEAAPTLPPLDPFLTHLEDRPDVKAAKARAAAADEAVSVARGEHLPSADIAGNYYFKRPDGPEKDIHWDVEATLSVPIFSGGVTHARVEEAARAREQAKLEVQRLQRSAEAGVRTAYDDLRADLDQVDALARTQKLSERNYQLLTRDYKTGLARNIDVLTALTTAEESRRLYDRAVYMARLDAVRLQVIASQRPPNPTTGNGR